MEELKPLQKSGDLRKRLISSFFILTASFLVIFAGPKWLFNIYVMVIILLGLMEYAKVVGNQKKVYNRKVLFILGLMVPFVLLWDLLSVFIPFAILSLFFANSDEKNLATAYRNSCVSFFGLFWIAWSFSYLIPIRSLPQGSWIVFYIILVTKMGDAGAYFVGKKLGHEKFVEHISPKKTKEGAYGQIVTSIVFSLLSVFYLDIAWYHLLVLGCLIGILAQLGDLVESIVKRHHRVKDSGMLPGLGGFLDIMDSILFTIPLVYFYVTRVAHP